jgi:hypothetical protein
MAHPACRLGPSCTYQRGIHFAVVCAFCRQTQLLWVCAFLAPKLSCCGLRVYDAQNPRETKPNSCSASELPRRILALCLVSLTFYSVLWLTHP